MEPSEIKTSQETKTEHTNVQETQPDPQQELSSNQVIPSLVPTQSKKTHFLLIIITALLAVGGFALYSVIKSKDNSVPVSQIEQITSKTTPQPTTNNTLLCTDVNEAVGLKEGDLGYNAQAKPLLSGGRFSKTSIDYPPEWPSEFRYPSQFILTEARSGVLIEGGRTIFSIVHIYNGSAEEASLHLGTYLQEQGREVTCIKDAPWQFLIQAPKENSAGLVTIEEDQVNSGTTWVVSAMSQE